MLQLLLSVAFLLPPGAQAGEIIGGREARPHSRPYMAYVVTEMGPETVTTCGGFLVREDLVLTAAHCDEEGSGDAPTRVLLGAHDLSQKERSQQSFQVRRKIPHEDFNKTTLENDIMLLQLESPAEQTDAVKPIQLPQDTSPLKPGTTCSVAGWGRTGVHIVHSSDKLREVTLKVADDERCESLFYCFNRTSMLCAGSSNTKQSSFKGDSGGPLVCRGVAQGIVSSGKESGLPPAVYTRISAFVPWLRKKMGRG